MVFVASIIRNKLCIIYMFFFQKSFFNENHFLIAAINLTTWGSLYTCLVHSAKTLRRQLKFVRNKVFLIIFEKKIKNYNKKCKNHRFKIPLTISFCNFILYTFTKFYVCSFILAQVITQNVNLKKLINFTPLTP